MRDALSEETWKPIPGRFSGYYEASSEGRIRSVDRVLTDSLGRSRAYTGQLRAATVNPHGYLQLGLSMAGRGQTFQVHSLIAHAFLGRPVLDGLQIRHLDGDPLNNRIENLQYGTALQNAADREIHGRTAKGESNGHSSLTAAKVLEIKAIHSAGGVSMRSLAKRYDVTHKTISRIVQGRTWTHLDAAQVAA